MASSDESSRNSILSVSEVHQRGDLKYSKHSKLPRPLDSTRSTGDSGEATDIETDKSQLPPLYVDIQEEVDQSLSEIASTYDSLKKLQAQRLRVSFDVDEKQEA